MNERIHRQLNAAPVAPLTTAPIGLLQRKCACGNQTMDGECEACGRKREDILRRKAADPSEINEAPPIIHEVLHYWPGARLDTAARAFFEPRFGHDFSDVRVHTGMKAAESARAVNALAYTVGHDVVFGSGQYAPETDSGRRLLAHELAHVAQQRNATYPANGISLGDPAWESEADAAAEAVMTGRPARVAHRAMEGAKLARQKITTDTKHAPAEDDGSKVDVTRVVTSGKCAETPETRTSAYTEITRSHAAINLSYCRGRTRAGAGGELDYSDVVRRAVSAAPNFFSGGNPQQSLRDLEQSFRQAEPRANVRFDLQVGGVKVAVTGSGRASVQGGASGEAGATVGGRIGTTGVEGGVTVSGGTQDPTQVGVTIKVTPGAGATEIPNCFKCVCSDPTIKFECVAHDPGTKDNPPPRAPQILYVPLFYEYQLAIPRTGWEENYKKALDSVVERIGEGYTIARIEGRTSPEGPLEKRKDRSFEGNIILAKSRARKANDDLQSALAKAIGREGMSMRDRAPLDRLKAAQNAAYPVEGVAPGGSPSSAELFGSGAKGEVSERDMLKHLRETLKAPAKGETDPLEAEHVIGQGLPPETQAEVGAEVEAFRTGKRDGKKLSDSDVLETIYRPLRRALIVLNPPPTNLQLSREAGERVTGRKIDCLPKYELLFDKISIPEDALYEGECRPKGAGVIKAEGK